MLTRTNYPEWALVMKVNFQTLGVWDVVRYGVDDDGDEIDDHDDRQAMAGLLRSVPSELWSTLAVKKTVKQAWDAVKALRIGDERARDASAQQLRQEFGAISFQEGETVNEFGVRITALATNLRSLGDNISDSEVVKKLLQVVPEKLSQAAVSLEMFLNLNTITIEEVIGRLRMFEERAKPKQITDAMGRLMLCEEDWEARRKARRDEENSGGNAGSSSSRGKRRGRGRGRGGGGSSSRDGRDGQSAGAGNSGGGRSPLGDRCKNCGKTGHWAKDCHGKKKAAAHVAQAQTDEEDPALMLATVELVAGDILEPAPAAPSPNPTSRRVDLVEAKVLFQRDG